MDAEAIYRAYRAKTLAKDGWLQHGPLLTDIDVLNIVPQGLTFRGGYVPDLNSRVVVHIGGMSVEGIMSSHGDLRGAILFVRPVPPSPP